MLWRRLRRWRRFAKVADAGRRSCGVREDSADCLGRTCWWAIVRWSGGDRSNLLTQEDTSRRAMALDPSALLEPLGAPSPPMSPIGYGRRPRRSPDRCGGGAASLGASRCRTHPAHVVGTFPIAAVLLDPAFHVKHRVRLCTLGAVESPLQRSDRTHRDNAGGVAWTWIPLCLAGHVVIEEHDE